MKRFLIIVLLLMVSACTTTNGTPAVTLTYPQTGTVIYAEAMTIQGSLQNTSELSVRTELINRETEEILAQATTTLGEVWTIELPLNYGGEPLQSTLRLLSEDRAITYTEAEIIIADQSFRPEGTFATILFPEDGSGIGGDSIQIDGTASGIRDNLLMLQLLNSSGEIIASHDVILVNPFVIDEVPWQFTIGLEDLTELRQIRLISNDENGEAVTLDEVNVEVGAAAG